MVDTKIEALADTLRARIENGEFGTGGRLPPRRTLASQLHTTQETMNKVIQSLESEGLLISGGKSTYVNPLRLRMPAIVPHFDRYVESQGLVPISTFLGVPDLIAAPSAIAEVMHVEPGTLVPHRLLRQDIQKDSAVVHLRLSENFYNPSFVDNEIFQGLQSDPQFDTLLAVKAKYGKVVVKYHIDAISRLPTPREQELLEIKRGTPVMELHRTNYSDDNTVVMVNKIVFVGNLVKVSYDSSASFWN